MLEPVQGEGGVNIASKEYIAQIRKLCDEKDILMIFDEVQTGMGRTGTMFAFEHYGIQPDLMLLAKALGGGLPIGALVVKEKIADTFQPGMHASTFGGSPLVCKAALGTFKAITADKMLKNTKAMGTYILEELKTLKEKFDCITDVRGLGLMIGIELNIEGKAIYEECFQNGLIINCTQGNILRFMPALKPVIQKRFPDSKIIYGEFISGLDAKMRYFQPLRIELYRKVAEWISARAPQAMIYLCMESDAVWKQSFGFTPSERGGLARMLDASAAAQCNLSAS